MHLGGNEAGEHRNACGRFRPAMPCSRNRQNGQALVFGIFVLLAGLSALFFFFNTGQLSREKTKLVNVADAAAYSAGVMHARAMNFAAYTNRAMMANTVTIAQLVSASSWVHYVATASISPEGQSIGDPTRYMAFFPGYMQIIYEGQLLKWSLVDSQTLEMLATASDSVIHGVLMNAQQTAYGTLPLRRQQVIADVINANYANDGTVTAEPLPSSQVAYQQFVRRYEGDERGRFADVALIAAKRDDFQKRRSWYLRALYPRCTAALLFGRSDWLDRRGGTELIGFDEWKAVDTLSEKRWMPRNKWDPFCQGLAEHPAGWGSQSAGDGSGPLIDPQHYDRSLIVNPGSTALAVMASSSDWDYKGLPSFYDLSPATLGMDDPRMRFAIRLRRKIEETTTSEGRSAIRSSARLNDYKATPAGGDELAAVAISEVFFERPDISSADCTDGSRMGRRNCYGEDAFGRDREIGSLFNPYWSVRLVDDENLLAEARAMQGAP